MKKIPTLTLKKREATKRQRQSIITRKKLFDTAVALFSSFGYDKVTVDDIVASAKTSKGAFYFHFPSKESVIIEVVSGADVQYQEWYERIDKNLSAIDQLLDFARTVNIYGRTMGVDLIKVLYINQIKTDTSHKKLLNDEDRPYFHIIHKIIEAGQIAGELRTDVSSEDLTRIFTRWIRSVLYNWCLYNGEYDVVEDGHTYFSFVLPTFRKSSD